jgi:hypothetical protein
VGKGKHLMQFLGFDKHYVKSKCYSYFYIREFQRGCQKNNNKKNGNLKNAFEK